MNMEERVVRKIWPRIKTFGIFVSGKPFTLRTLIEHGIIEPHDALYVVEALDDLVASGVLEHRCGDIYALPEARAR